MRKILVIAAREYMAAVRTKAFLIGLVFMPVMVFGCIALQEVLKKQVDTREKRFAVVDRTEHQAIVPILELAVSLRNANQVVDPETKALTGAPFAVARIEPSADTPEAIDRQRFELSQRVRRGEFFGFLEIGPNVARPLITTADVASAATAEFGDDRQALRYQSNRPLYLDFSRWAEKVISTAVQFQRGTTAGLSFQNASAVIQPVPLVAKGLSRRDPKMDTIVDAQEDTPLNSVLVPMSLTVLMLMMLMVGTSPLMQSVMEEKSQRIAEVLLGSVRPFDLMTGKLLGMVCVSLTTVAVYLIGAYIAAHRYGFGDDLTLGVIGWYLLFQILGVLMYGSLFIAIGAACIDAKEAQSLLMPVMLVATAPVFALPSILRDPSSAFATGLSFFPFVTPMLMTSRIALPPGIAWWQPTLGVAGVLLTTIACIYAGGRVFRVGLLMQGKGARYRDLVRWVIKG